MNSTQLAISINREPPDFWEIRGLTKVYVDSSEIFSAMPLELREYQLPKKRAILLNERTALLWWKGRVPRPFKYVEKTRNELEIGSWRCLILNLDGIADEEEGRELSFRRLGIHRCVKACDCWRKALYEALLFELNRRPTKTGVANRIRTGDPRYHKPML
jgi:hypothetical protein